MGLISKLKGIINPDGSPVTTETLTEKIAGPSLTGVRSVISGHPAQGLTPGKLARVLLSAETGETMAYFELAEEMEEKDLHYLGVLGTRKRAVTGLEIEIEAADESAAAQKQADFIRDILNRETLQDELFDVMDAVGKGISLTEIIWERDAREWRPARFEWRDPRWFTFDRHDGRTPLIRDGSLGTHLPQYKFITHEVKAKSGLPIRGGIARAAAWGYMFKNYTVKDWIVFAEVYGQPIRVGKYHASATEEERAVLRRAVAMIGTDAGAIIPDSMLIEFLNSSGTSSSVDLYERLANWMDYQVSKAVLGQTTTTDAVSGGHAVSKEHNEVRKDILKADTRQLAATLNLQVVRAAIDLNFGAQDRYPKIKLLIPESIDLEKFSTSIKTFVETGGRVPAKWARDKMGVPDPEDGDELLEVAAASPAPAPAAQATALAATQLNRDVIDESIDDILAQEGFDPMEPILAPILEALKGAASYAEFEALLPDLLEKMDINDLAKLMGNSLFSAQIAGQLGIPLGDE